MSTKTLPGARVRKGKGRSRPPGRPGRPRAKTRIIHSSGRFDRSLRSLDDSIDYLRKHSTLMIHTEQTRNDARDKVAFTNKGWGFIHLDGSGASECVISWKLSEWASNGHGYAHKVTNMTWTRAQAYGGQEAAKVHALVQPLKHLPTGRKGFVIAVHMPLDNTAKRAAVWRDCCRGLRALIRALRRKHKGCFIVLSADWNKNWREGDERAALQKHIGKPLRLTYQWDGEAHSVRGGTHGKALIDGFYTDLNILDGYLLPDDDSSDHRPCGGLVDMGAKREVKAKVAATVPIPQAA